MKDDKGIYHCTGIIKERFISDDYFLLVMNNEEVINAIMERARSLVESNVNFRNVKKRWPSRTGSSKN